MKNRSTFYLIALLSVFVSNSALANEPVSTAYFSNKAIGGHDTIGYHGLQQGAKAIKGQQTYTATWKGAEWHFVSEAQKQAFLSDPTKYAPAYNGHCANALSLGEGLIPTSGKHWLVLDKQLYLFYAARGVNRWLSGDYQEYKTEADKAWQTLANN